MFLSSADIRNAEVVDRVLVITRMLKTLALWLYVCVGVSRATVNTVNAALHLILTALLAVIALALPGTMPPSLAPKLPRDIRTIIADLQIEPEIVRNACCTKCFTSYALGDIPEFCTWRETPRSKACGERLLKQRRTRKHGTKLVPRTLFSRQSFESWLRFFLARPDTEKWLEKAYAYQPAAGIMNGIWDSPAWKSLFTFTTTDGCLTFSLYIDWFNPLTNKIAGKKISCGAVILCCMNLPPELRYLPENVFFAGLIPGPKEPSIITMTHVLDPIVSDLLPFWTGKILPTYSQPAGRLIRVALIPVIADLIAIRKMSGFGAHSCTHFCSYCHCTLDEIERLDIENFVPRNRNEVKEQAEKWRALRTKRARKDQFRETGVRWSPLHNLPYWDPVRHLVLGYMHNTLEGILQHHSRTKWGIGSKTRALPFLVGDGSTVHGDDEQEQSELDSELEDLRSDSSAHEDSPAHSVRERSQSSAADAMIVDGDEQHQLPGDEADDDPEFVPSDDGSDEEDPQPLDEPLAKHCIFSTVQLELIRTCFLEAQAPAAIERPPANFGEPSHGRLKAIQWLTTFTNFLPLVVPEIWTDDSDAGSTELLQNFYHLVSSTNIISSYSYTMQDPDRYLAHYLSYRQSCQRLFSHSRSVPNHHYAMHNAEIMRFWGPLPLLSEFPYEQKNGVLQKINTNRRMCAYLRAEQLLVTHIL